MKFLVAGGAGFLGAHLTKALLDDGHEVLVFDNLCTGRLRNLVEFKSREGFSFLEGDITDPLPPVLYEERFDGIYNLACPASPPHYQRDPIFTMRTNVLGTLGLLELARRQRARFFQASTSEIYGDPEVHPQPETYRGSVNTLGPRACYDEGKRAAETICADFQRTYSADVRIVRIFNTYGPKMDASDGRVVSNFIVQALKGAPLSVYGKGHQTRSFCYVDDLIRGFLSLMSHPSEGRPVNIGNDSEFTVLELATLVKELCHSHSDIVYQPLPNDDPAQRRPDLRRAREVLGYEHRVPLREGLLKTIDYFRDHLED